MAVTHLVESRFVKQVVAMTYSSINQLIAFGSLERNANRLFVARSRVEGLAKNNRSVRNSSVFGLCTHFHHILMYIHKHIDDVSAVL